MKISWLFGNSLQAHHLLYAYLTVWIVQGGYFGWTAWRWLSVRRIRG